MRVILLQKLNNLGNLGDQIEVKKGFARNYLIPQGKAVQASKDNIAYFETRRAELEAQQASRLTQAQNRAAKLAELALVIKANAGEDGKLFGSVGVRDIAAAITAAGENIDKREIVLPSAAFRQLGEHAVSVQLHPDVKQVLNVSIVAAKP